MLFRCYLVQRRKESSLQIGVLDCGKQVWWRDGGRKDEVEEVAEKQIQLSPLISGLYQPFTVIHLRTKAISSFSYFALFIKCTFFIPEAVKQSVGQHLGSY